MPRVNLTDLEAQLIEAHRRKNLEVNAFNEGLDRARQLIRAEWGEDGPIYSITKLEEAIQSERRQVKL